MICYKDKTFCANGNCLKYRTCDKNLKRAQKERDSSDSEYIRKLPIAVTVFEECAEYENTNYTMKGLDIFDDIQWQDKEPFEILSEIIDWDNIPVNTKVFVKNKENDRWFKAYFSHYSKTDKQFYCFKDGQTKWSSNGESVSWEMCSLTEE